MHSFMLQWIRLGNKMCPQQLLENSLTKLRKKKYFLLHDCTLFFFFLTSFVRNSHFLFGNAQIFSLWLQCFKKGQQTHKCLVLINYGEGKHNFLPAFPVYTWAPGAWGQLGSGSREAAGGDRAPAQHCCLGSWEQRQSLLGAKRHEAAFIVEILEAQIEGIYLIRCSRI